MGRGRRICVLALVALLPAGLAQSPETTDGDTIRVEVNVVNLPVTVTDSQGLFIADLNKDDFTVWEDGEEVEIRYFTRSVEEEKKPPLYAGFIIDLSNTARLYYKTYQTSIGDLAWMLVPEGGRNQGFLFGYHTEVDELVDFTNDPVTLTERMESLKHGGGSAMFDAIYRACTEKLVSIPYQGASEPRKVVVVIGDGHDNASKRSIDEVIFAAQLHQVTIYAVSTVGWGYHHAEEANLVRLAGETGGRVVRPMQDVHKDVSGYLSKPQDAGNYQYEVGTGGYAAAQLQALYKAILDVAGNVSSQYILGYVPARPFSDRRFRLIEVELGLAGAAVEVYHRRGYFPPTVEAEP
ncbi:MAG: VWA domain-containing protein [Bryobacterales bacterium]|nr:VWA domain-containing protein [Bryobacterales bacterium]